MSVCHVSYSNIGLVTETQ